MSRIVIIIEDLPNGGVEVHANPTFESMASQVASGNDLTPAQGYAMKCINVIRAVSKKQTPTNKILIPRIGK